MSASSAYLSMSTCRLIHTFWTPSRQSRLPILLSSPRYQRYATSTDNLFRVAQSSIWHSIIPTAFRQRKTSQVPAKVQRSTEWNPATFFIWIFLLIGSNGIQMLTLRNEYSTSSRKVEEKLALLKEVLEKVQRGENVDVENILGTGDRKQEEQWADVISDILLRDDLWAIRERRRERRRLNKEEAKSRARETAAQTPDDIDSDDPNPLPDQAKKPPKFY